MYDKLPSLVIPFVLRHFELYAIPNCHFNPTQIAVMRPLTAVYIQLDCGNSRPPPWVKAPHADL